MNKTYFVSYWDRESKQASRAYVEINVPESATQGMIASLIDDKLPMHARLINFWEM